MELPVEGPFSQITVLLSANVNKELEARATTTKLNSHSIKKPPSLPCQVTGFKWSTLRSVCKRGSEDEYTPQTAKGLNTLCLEALCFLRVGGWDATGRCYFATRVEPVKDCIVSQKINPTLMIFTCTLTSWILSAVHVNIGSWIHSCPRLGRPEYTVFPQKKLAYKWHNDDLPTEVKLEVWHR